MQSIGGIFGIITFLLVIFLVLRLLFFIINRSVSKAGKKLPKWFTQVNKILRVPHRYVGIVAILTVIIHGIIQATQLSVSPIGMVGAILLIIQGAIGFAMLKAKDRAHRQPLQNLHYGLGLAALVAILAHRLT